MEDVRKQLEKYFRSKREVPQKIEEVIKLGEKEIDSRIKILRMADKVSWAAVEKFVSDPLCDNDEEDRRWKQAIKEAKEEMAKRRNGSSGDNSRNRGKDSFRSVGRSYRRDSRERRPDRYVESVGDDMKRVCSGERQGLVTAAERRDTLRKTVGSLPGEMESREEGVTISDGRVFDMDVPHACNKYLGEKKGFDLAEERLDMLEGKLVEGEPEVCVMHEEDEKIEEKIHGTLRKHVRFWQESGASDFFRFQLF